jgi:hypothetical protein
VKFKLKSETEGSLLRYIFKGWQRIYRGDALQAETVTFCSKASFIINIQKMDNGAMTVIFKYVESNFSCSNKLDILFHTQSR